MSLPPFFSGVLPQMGGGGGRLGREKRGNGEEGRQGGDAPE